MISHRKESVHAELEKKKIRSDQFTRVAIVLVVLLLSAMLFLITIEATQAERQATLNGKLLREVQENSAILKDCTTPGGGCYQERRQRDMQTIDGVNKGTMEVIAAAIACEDDGVTGQLPMVKCIERRLTK